MSASTPTPVAGLELAPFRAWRYDESVVGDLGAVLSPPNDVLSADDIVSLEARSPWNACHLSRPPSYAAAAATLASWISSGVLARDPEPALYAYEQLLPSGRRVRGLLGALALTPPDAGIVLPHENTRPGPIADRLALMNETGADLEPILVVYDGGPMVAGTLERALGGQLLAEATTPDGIGHRLAGVTGTAELEAIAGELRPRRALIADGHHRYATYLQRQQERRAEGAGAGPWDFGLALLVDGSEGGLEVRPIHRVVEGLALDAALATTAAVARVTDLTTGQASVGTVPAGPAAVAPPGCGGRLAAPACRGCSFGPVGAGFHPGRRCARISRRPVRRGCSVNGPLPGPAARLCAGYR